MKFGRLSGVPIAVSILATLGFTQLTNPTETSNAATELRVKYKFDGKAKLKVTLRIYDFAEIDSAVLAAARKVTTEIFREAGLEAAWLDCPVSEANCDKEGQRPQFRLRILPPALAKNMIKDEALGFAVPCAKNEEACLFYIFYSPISTLAAKNGLSPDMILGHVMAHEIGHTLLGPNAHDLYGIMQASLPLTDIGRILYFTSTQSRHLRTELLARKRATNRYERQPQTEDKS